MGEAGVLILPQAKVVGSEIFQIIRNAGFEDACTADDWVDPTRTTDEANSGSYSAKIRIGYFEDFQQTLLSTVKANDVESFTFYIKGANGIAAVNVDVYYTDETHTTHQYNGATDWTQKTITGMSAGKSIEYIKFRAIQSGYVVYIDDVSLIAPLAQEIILNINVHLGCSTEVSSFEIVVDRGNPDYGYDALLNPGDEHSLDTGMDLELYLGRPDEEGVSPSLLLTGQIDEIEYIDEVEEYQFRNICIVRGRCNGYQLFGRYWDGDLIATVGTGYLNYTRTSGDASSMVAYLIDNYTSLSHVRVSDDMAANATAAQNNVTVDDGSVFTIDQLVKIQDDNGWEYNRIDSIAGDVLTMYDELINNYTTVANGKVWIDLIEKTGDSDAQDPTAFTELIYSHTIVFDIIKYIAEVVDLDGTIGYDTRVEYDGKFAFFSKGSKTESYSLQDDCQLNRYLKDANRIRNKIWVYGKEDKPYPTDVDGQVYGDSWSDLATPCNQAELAANANSGQADITVGAGQGAQYSADDVIWIADNAAVGKGEQLIIESVAADVITCTTNLVNSYTTAAQGIIYELFTNGGWGFFPWDADGAEIVSEATIVHTGSRSVEFQVTSAITSAQSMFVFRSGTTVDMDDYKRIRALLYFATNQPDYIQVRLYSDETVNGYAYSNPVTINKVDEWVEIDIEGGTNSAENWNVGSSFDWNAVKRVGIYVNRAAGGTWTFYIDRIHFFGKRWGGGSDDATVDGFAEDGTSQTTYGIKELVVINDLLLSDAECEAKAQALIEFYASERIVIEVSGESIDWLTYNPMAGNKVAVDLDEIEVTGSTYRIDSIDIGFRGQDNSLTAIFTLDDTPIKLADYLYKISERLRNLERDYKRIR